MCEVKLNMPTIICRNTLETVREWNSMPESMAEWYQGRAMAAALIHPTIENISAAHEVRFLTGDYARRHYHV